MAFQDVVNDWRSRLQEFGKQAREALETVFNTNRQAFSLVVDGAQSVAKTEVGVARGIYGDARSSFEKARKDGIKKVADKPSKYLPDAVDRVSDGYSDTVKVIRSARQELVETFRQGYQDLRKVFGAAETEVKATAKKTTSQARKTASKAKRKTTATKRKTAGKATKKTAKATS